MVESKELNNSNINASMYNLNSSASTDAGVVGGNSANSNNPNVPDPASLLTENDYESNKIFAGGLCRSTTEEQLKKYFESFGQVTETEIVKDKVSGRSRGFGFVTFASKTSVKEVLSQVHKIKGIEIEVKLAVRKEKSKILAPKYDENKRIFVGGISEKITDSYFKNYFERYGPISSYNYLMDKRTNKPRGYGFVIYENEEDAEKSIGTHTSLGRFCEAKFAQNRTEDKFQNNLQNFDYSAYYYAQANLLYSQYLSQLYNGITSDKNTVDRSIDQYTDRSDNRSNYRYDRSRGSSVDSRNRSSAKFGGSHGNKFNINSSNSGKNSSGNKFDNNGRYKRRRSRSPPRDRRSSSRGRRRYRY